MPAPVPAAAPEEHHRDPRGARITALRARTYPRRHHNFGGHRDASAAKSGRSRYRSTGDLRAVRTDKTGGERTVASGQRLFGLI